MQPVGALHSSQTSRRLVGGTRILWRLRRTDVPNATKPRSHREDLSEKRRRMNGLDMPKALSTFEALVPIVSLILLVAIAYYIFGEASTSGPTQVALVVATMIAVFIAWRRGHSLSSLNAAATASVSSGIGAIFILFAVGALIGTWALSGTLIAMVYYGMQILNPAYFYVTAAAICAVVSFCIGSSWTVVGTIGIGLMGIALSIDMDPAITAGAVISGAYFGDTISPLSDSANLVAGMVGANLYEHIRETALTTSGALAIALLVFWTIGKPADFDISNEIAAIERAFDVSPVLSLPLIVVVGLALCRLPPFTSIFIGAIVACALAAIIAPERVMAFASTVSREDLPPWLLLLKGVWLAFANGYVSATGVADIDQLLSRGGMESMLNTIWLVIAALAFGGVVEKAGVLDKLVRPVINAAKTAGTLIISLVAAVFATNVVTADQYISIALPGRMFKTAFASRGFAPVVLSRAVGGAATPTSALVPWNSCGAYMAATLGVATLDYVPYAIFSLLSPLLVVVVAFAGVRMQRVSDTDKESSEQRGRTTPDGG
ncbi:Na+/H+ antiporter NhaC family protein [Chelativorans sp. AA-79]|uniref:Na+/H+ antiporter NhaC family protein n=1 Tax=Chelativorans sp. AA-79 TaxID=3028735 RepID=UPI0023F70F32|nr:Na+/H+ antiporter NhaC family protein [Chelativorans sp. AA-79]WEX10760.1 Na+/H+ antiporter NhaC family protein [Chelativorans sp. AA-79]